MINQFIKKELRKNCKWPKEFQLKDFVGVTFGLFFLVDSIIRIKKGTNGFAVAELVIGSTMAAVHSAKFFYAKDLGME